MDTSLQPLQHCSAHKASLSQGLSTKSVELGCMLVDQHEINNLIRSVELDLSNGKIFTTMEWLMIFVKVPL